MSYRSRNSIKRIKKQAYKAGLKKGKFVARKRRPKRRRQKKDKGLFGLGILGL